MVGSSGPLSQNQDRSYLALKRESMAGNIPPFSPRIANQARNMYTEAHTTRAKPQPSRPYTKSKQMKSKFDINHTATNRGLKSPIHGLLSLKSVEDKSRPKISNNRLECSSRCEKYSWFLIVMSSGRWAEMPNDESSSSIKSASVTNELVDAISPPSPPESKVRAARGEKRKVSGDSDLYSDAVSSGQSLSRERSPQSVYSDVPGKNHKLRSPAKTTRVPVIAPKPFSNQSEMVAGRRCARSAEPLVWDDNREWIAEEALIQAQIAQMNEVVNEKIDRKWMDRVRTILPAEPVASAIDLAEFQTGTETRLKLQEDELRGASLNS